MRHRSTALATVAALGLLSSVPVAAQSVVWSTVSGTVTSAVGGPVGRALVTLTAVGLGTPREASTDASGRFTFALVGPGSYEVRVEAFGYRPVVARGLVVGGEESADVALRLAAAEPPVLTVDTIDVPGGGSNSWRGAAVHLGPPDFLADLPDRFGDLSALAGLASMSDRALGAVGLPGSMTVLVADGVPVYRAPHPTAAQEHLSTAIFPRAALSSLMVSSGTPDTEWGGSAGGHLGVATRSGAQAAGGVLEASWSGTPLWSSTKLNFDTPPLTSFRAAGHASFELSPGSSQLFVGAEGLQEESPFGPRIDGTLAASLAGLDSRLISSLSDPSTERVSRYAALARADVQRSPTSRLFFRGSVAYSKREFDGAGPVTLARQAAPAEESVDFSLASGFISQFRPGLDFEVRAGFSRSGRTFAPTDGLFAVGLAGSASSLGVAPGESGESSRADFVLLPIVHLGVGNGSLKLGSAVRATNHRMSPEPPTELLYSDGATLVGGQGFVRASTAPEATFMTQELGAFAQYTLSPSPGVRLSVGGRYDHEMLPASDVVQDTVWVLTTGLPNGPVPDALGQWSATGSLTWDPAGDGSTRVVSAVSLHQGDVDTRAVAQLLTQDLGATSTRYAGPGLTWPGSSVPGTATALPMITLMSPNTRAPRSLHASVGATRRLAAGWTLQASGEYRRTDFLIRRRDLNIPVLPQAVDAQGRDVFGTLQQDGALVSTTASDARRFPAFNEVWALEPDGWSEYRGVTFGLEHVGLRSRFFAAYTLAETTDNWIGASQASPEAELSPLLPEGDADWSEGTSDFDVRHRVSASGSIDVAFATLAAVYHLRSGLSFTPGYRQGVDANGDGSFRNDVAYVDAAVVDPLLSDWPCLSSQVGGFAVRNSCRGSMQHSLDVRVRVGLGRLAGRSASLVLDAFNLIESREGVIDDALLLVDPAGSIVSSGGTVTIPVTVNPDFGEVRYPSSRGRVLRIGFRIG